MEKSKRTLLFAFGFLLLFLVIAFFVKAGIGFTALDNSVSSFFAERQSEYGTQVMWAISFLSDIYVLPFFVVIVSLVFYYRGKKKEAGFYFFTFAVGAVIGEIVKAGFGRARPVNIFEQGFGFPSIHAFSAVVAFFGLAYLLWNKNRKISYGLIVFGLLVAFSRIYLNVHWVSDVLAGFALGFGFLFMGIWIFFSRND